MLRIIVAGLLGSLFSQSVFSVDEMVVSTFRTTDAEQLTSSVTVIDADTIRQTPVQHFEALIARVPNLNYSGDGNRARFFQIRGIGELEQYEGAPNPSVGFIIDDIDLSGLGSAATLFDVEQIDVLRGPQGTRFGANALAGLIYVKSTDPTGTFESRVEATAGTDDTYGLGGLVSGPIGDSASYRLSVHHFQSDGFQRNVTLGRDDTNGYDEWTTRAKFRFEPADGWRIDLTGLYADLDNGYDAWAVDNNGSVTYADKPGRDAQETAAGSLRISGDFSDRLTFVSITGLAHTDTKFSFDGDWGSDAFWDTPRFGNAVYDFFSATHRERDTLSQEFRLLSGEDGRLFGYADWLVGVYGLTLDEDLDKQDSFRDDFFCIAPCVTPFASRFESQSGAVFGELGLPVGSDWRLDLGLRWEHWDADYTDSAVSFAPDDNLWGGHVNLSYQLSAATMLYGRLARGYKAGGFNLNPSTPPGLVMYDDESLLNYELGLKFLNIARTVRADLVAYYMDRDDMQTRVSLQLVPGDPLTFIFLTDNAESGRNLGLETSIDWQFSEAWSVFGALGLQDTEIRSFTLAPALEGRSQAHAPAYNFQVGTAWRHPNGWFARVELIGMDEFYYDVSHDEKSPASERVNLRFGREWGAWSFIAWAQNIFDENYSVRGFYFGNEPPDFPDKLYEQSGEPRQIGLTVNWFFR